MIVSSHAKKLIFTRNVSRAALVRKRGFWNSGNSLFFLLRRHGWTCYLHSWRSLVFREKKKQTKNVSLANRQKSIFIVLSSVSVEVSWRIVCARKGKTNGATMTSFPWSVLLSSIALHQSAREKSLSYLESESRNFLDEDYWQRWNLWTWEIFFGSHLFVVFYTYLRRWSTLKFTRVYNNISHFFVRHFL